MAAITVKRPRGEAMINILANGTAKYAARIAAVRIGARAAAFAGTLALGFAVYLTPAAAQSCKKTVDAINSSKITRQGYENQQKALQERIDKIEKGEQSYRQKIQAAECRPEGAAATDDKRMSCKVLLQVILEAGKIRDSLKRQIDGLKQMTTAAAGSEAKLIRVAKSDGCPPYATEKRKAKASASKKTAHKSSKRHVTARHPPPEGPPDEGGGPVIQFGVGGIGIGIGF
jgi:hypothetical protein